MLHVANCETGGKREMCRFCRFKDATAFLRGADQRLGWIDCCGGCEARGRLTGGGFNNPNVPTRNLIKHLSGTNVSMDSSVRKAFYREQL